MLATKTLQTILDELPQDERFATWRGKLRRVLGLSRLEVSHVERLLLQA